MVGQRWLISAPIDAASFATATVHEHERCRGCVDESKMDIASVTSDQHRVDQSLQQPPLGPRKVSENAQSDVLPRPYTLLLSAGPPV